MAVVVSELSDSHFLCIFWIPGVFFS
uniref:Uncharacterized protein n=1 Tax=Anguilla anguilla TaxID=7936 RepID=A0A0E9PT66_ANGAN